MKQFPNTLTPLKKSTFKDTIKERVLEALRESVYSHMLKDDENDFFDLDKFNKNVKNMELTKHLINTYIIPELNELGWKTRLSYGDTGLFIFSTEDKPRSCW